MLEDLKERVNAKSIALYSVIGTGSAVALPCVAFADDATVASTLTTGVTGAVTQAQDAIIAVLPQALVLMGVIVGITVGVRLFKRVGK